MSKRRHFRILLCIVVLFCATFYMVTRGNVRWRVLHDYPSAEIELWWEGYPEPSLDGSVLRALGFRYISPLEEVRIGITDHPTPVDLRRFHGMSVGILNLRNCVIADIKPLLAMYRPQVSFMSCDFSGLPDEQKRFLYYQPQFGRFCLDTPDDAVVKYPGGVGLHSEHFYP